MVHFCATHGELRYSLDINPLNAELNPNCHLLALLRAHHILHVSRIRVNHRVKVEKWKKWNR